MDGYEVPNEKALDEMINVLMKVNHMVERITQEEEISRPYG